MSLQPPPFLVRYLPPPSSRPVITLTWAQSLDSKIAGKGGARVLLSGQESMLMTHWMRTMHDAILVGINTIVLDDPRLKRRDIFIVTNARRHLDIQLIPTEVNASAPQPLILDPTLRFPLSSRILSEWNERSAKVEEIRQPWILCGEQVAQNRIRELEEAGAKVIPVKLDSDGRIPPRDLPDILSKLALRSVMIEGGSRILSAFLHSEPRSDGSPVVDNIVITVAPMFIGEGVGVVPDEEGGIMPVLETVHTETMGKDAVMFCRIKP